MSYRAMLPSPSVAEGGATEQQTTSRIFMFAQSQESRAGVEREKRERRQI